MAFVTESPVYEAGIYQLETTDPVLGGASGVSNLPIKHLANRTAWLKAQISSLGIDTTGATAITTLTPANNPGVYFTGSAVSGIPIAENGFIYTAKYDPAGTAVYITQTFYSVDSDRIFTRRASPASSNTFTTWVEVAYSSALAALSDQFVASVSGFARNTPPTGWLKANGAAVSRTTYAALFGAIGTTFGSGNGSTTFNLPDLRGEFVRGWIDDRAGFESGRVYGSAQADELKSHVHAVKKNNLPRGTGANFFAMDDAGVDGTENTEMTGGTETRPRNVALLYCIKY